jgi:hypothetical protein
MNERIEELLMEAHKQTKGGIYNGHPSEWTEKFAELIVRECVQTLIDNTPDIYTNESAEEDWDKGYDRVMKDWVHHIQEHFGIEE